MNYYKAWIPKCIWPLSLHSSHDITPPTPLPPGVYYLHALRTQVSDDNFLYWPQVNSEIYVTAHLAQQLKIQKLLGIPRPFMDRLCAYSFSPNCLRHEPGLCILHTHHQHIHIHHPHPHILHACTRVCVPIHPRLHLCLTRHSVHTRATMGTWTQNI